MKHFLIIVPFLFLQLMGKDNIVDKDIWIRFNELCVRTEWAIKSDHEYYMSGVPRSYALQVIRNENDKLYELLIKPKVLEEELIERGVGVNQALKDKTYDQKLILPQQKQDPRVIIYSFSSVN